MLFSIKSLYMIYIILIQIVGMPCFIVLRSIALRRYCVLYEAEVCGNHAWSKSVGAILLCVSVTSHVSGFAIFLAFL